MPRSNAWMNRLRAFLPEPPADATPLDRRTSLVFIVSIVLLILFQYFGKPESYRAMLGKYATQLQPMAESLLGMHANMAPFVHWGIASIVLRVLVPFAIIAFVFREPLSNYGWRWRGTLKHVPMYAALYVLMVPLIVWAATQDSFQQKYPFYKNAAEGGFSFWGYELAYGAQFAGVEFFFRDGALQQAAAGNFWCVRCGPGARGARASRRELRAGHFPALGCRHHDGRPRDRENTRRAPSGDPGNLLARVALKRPINSWDADHAN
jgi:hypothetical protein